MSVFEHDRLPTADEIETYRDQGWLLTDLRVSSAWLDACREAAEALYACRYDQTHAWSRSRGVAGYGQPYDDRTQPRFDAYASHHNRVFAAVVRAPALGAYAAALAGARRIRLFRDLLISVPARSHHGTGLHIDKNYWLTCASDRLLSAWFSLDDCGVGDGCLAVVSGSHRWPRSSFMDKLAFDDREAHARRFPDHRVADHLVSVPHRRGQVSFHSCLLLHGAHPNAGDKARQSLAVVLQDETNVYERPAGVSRARLSFNTNDHVGPRDDTGRPDYQSDDFYPLLHDAGAASQKGPA